MRLKYIFGMLAVSLLALAFAAGSAAAVTPAAHFTIDSLSQPSNFSTGDNAVCLNHLGATIPDCDGFKLTVRNAGSEPTDGSTITVADALPAGLSAQRIVLEWSGLPSINLGEAFCNTTTVECEFPIALAPDETLTMFVYVTVNEPAVPRSVLNAASVSGGGVEQASTSVRSTVESSPPSFGFSGFASLANGLDGAPDTQAGDHPYELATRIDLNNKLGIIPNAGGQADLGVSDVRDLKDVVVDLPLGFLGSALAAPECTLAQLSSAQGCPADTRIGHILTEPPRQAEVNSYIYNMVPEHGVAAEFGFVNLLHGSHFLYSSVVPTPAGYVLRTTSPGIAQIALTDIAVELYGDPAAKDSTGNTPTALFTNPSSCSGEPLVTSIHADSWQEPARFNADGTPDFSDPNWVASDSESPPVTGCNLLRFEPTLSVRPEASAADAPTGLDVGLKVPQSEAPGTLATPPLRDASVTLPAGLTVNPSAAGGLGACSEAQIGWLGGSLSNFTPDPPACPEDSKIGTVELATPLVAGTLTGSIYLATQDQNPFHTLLAGYIVIDDPATGVVVKIPGDLTPDPGTGQITGVFKDNPQFPFSELKLHFFGGARGELATPQGCGTFTTTSDLMPWSAPDSGPDATPSDSFQITSGCTSAFTPGFVAGSENPQAGAYAPFTLSLSRNDGEQGLAGLSVTLPPGSLGKIAGIPLCPDANANAGTCPEASRIGSVTAGAGAGPDPYFVSGRAYLTGPYKGGPYGLVEEVPAVAGPFDLGTVVVRQSLRIDPHTAQVTALSDPLPTILDGIPLRVRRVDVTLDRPGFTFNPTNCAVLAVTGTVTSTQGASANVSSRFQAGGCGELPFRPSFKVSTQARTSKRNGASLDVKVGYPKGAQSNIHSVAVMLPKQLPSRLTTIQQACPEATFAANPAGCPAGSVIGTGTARTPILANPVTGPAYLVSHGGAAFPDVVLVLQGEGITLDLVGSVNIKKSITSSKFGSVPDAPISSFELNLPEGPHSGLAAVVPAKAKGNLCGQSLVMPTTMIGQNGAVVRQSTKIKVTGCPKVRKKKAKHTRGLHGKKHKQAKK